RTEEAALYERGLLGVTACGLPAIDRSLSAGGELVERRFHALQRRLSRDVSTQGRVELLLARCHDLGLDDVVEHRVRDQALLRDEGEHLVRERVGRPVALDVRD